MFVASQLFRFGSAEETRKCLGKKHWKWIFRVKLPCNFILQNLQATITLPGFDNTVRKNYSLVKNKIFALEFLVLIKFSNLK